MTDSTDQEATAGIKPKNVAMTTRRVALMSPLVLAACSKAISSGERVSDDGKLVAACSEQKFNITEFLEQFSQPLPEPVEAKESTAKIGTANIWYRDTGGTGETIILVHPSNLSGHCWGYQEKGFSEAGYRVISYSRRGYRGSDFGVPEDKADAVDDLRGLVDYFKLEKFHIVSSAGGGAVGAAYAARYADDTRLKRLIIACSMAMFETSNSEDGKLILPQNFMNFRTVPKHVAGLGVTYGGMNEAGVEAWKEIINRAGGEQKLDMTKLQSMGAISNLSGFNKIKVPTLYIAGGSDVLCTPVLMETYYRNTPNADFGILNGAGHTAFWEAPNAFNAMVLDYLRG